MQDQKENKSFSDGVAFTMYAKHSRFWTIRH